MTNYEIESPEWWVQRWNDLLNSYRFKKRLERARNYAREGNVLSIEFKGPQVLAKVQGTAPEPYQVSLSIDPFSEEDWNYVVETMAEQAIYSAHLLAGEMPHNIEQVFTANGLSLFPFTLSIFIRGAAALTPKIPVNILGQFTINWAIASVKTPLYCSSCGDVLKNKSLMTCVACGVQKQESRRAGKQKSRGVGKQSKNQNPQLKIPKPHSTLTNFGNTTSH
jgi:hypothetical protein